MAAIAKALKGNQVKSSPSIPYNLLSCGLDDDSFIPWKK
jgi:hypothetical protein